MSLTLSSAAASHNSPPVEYLESADHEFLSFRLGETDYGVDILKVQEIRGYEEPTQVAGAPAFIKGVMNLRGVIVPIIDLRLRLRLAHAPYDSVTVTMVLSLQARVVGMVVDSVTDVVKLKGVDIKPAPQFDGAADAAFVRGIGTLRQGDVERTMLLLDIDGFIADSDCGMPQVTH